MEMREFLLGHTQFKRVGSREDLDIFPGNELVGKIVREEKTKGLIHPFLPPHPSHQSSETHIHMNESKTGIDAKEMEVIHTHHLGSEGIDNLFVDDLLSEEDMIFPGRRGRHGAKGIFRKEDLRFDSEDLFPGQIERCSSSFDHETHDHGIRFCPLGNEVRNPAHFMLGGAIDPSIQEVAEEIKIFKMLVHPLFLKVLPLPIVECPGTCFNPL
jgi:hypothetical protein